MIIAWKLWCAWLCTAEWWDEEVIFQETLFERVSKAGKVGFAVTSYLHGMVYSSHRYAKKQGHNGAQGESWYLPDLFDGPRGEKKENGMSSNDVVLVVWRG